MTPTVKKMIKAIWFLALLQAATVAHGRSQDRPAPVLGAENLAAIDRAVQQEIGAGRVGGAVVLIGNREDNLYRQAYGYRAKDVPMTADTIFDLASLTKVVATTTAIMQLAGQGKLGLDDPAARYWRGFGRNGKSRITVRQLLTHYSGLRADLELNTGWSGYRRALRLIAMEKPVSPPGTSYLYSDINFEVLGELVRRISAEPLDAYCARHIFKPSGMKDTGFAPSSAERVAPSGYIAGKLRQGEVHDPTAYRMGGVAGHAGLFSTADDLAIFARALLGGAGDDVFLSRAAVEEMSVPRSPSGGARLRGLGWDVAAPLALNRDALPPVGSYGHTGYTGTMLWIDPVSQLFVVVLTNRLYPDGRGDAAPLRKAVLQAVSDASGPLTASQVVARRPSLISCCSPATGPAENGTLAGTGTTGTWNLPR